jgi:hypothetical protein
MNNFCLDQGRTWVFGEATSLYAAAGNSWRTQIRVKRAIYGWKLLRTCPVIRVEIKLQYIFPIIQKKYINILFKGSEYLQQFSEKDIFMNILVLFKLRFRTFTPPQADRIL